MVDIPYKANYTNASKYCKTVHGIALATILITSYRENISVRSTATNAGQFPSSKSSHKMKDG